MWTLKLFAEHGPVSVYIMNTKDELSQPLILVGQTTVLQRLYTIG